MYKQSGKQSFFSQLLAVARATIASSFMTFSPHWPSSSAAGPQYPCQRKNR
ncbi:hypothetical protein GW17_00059225 [Ensete ventricosum]|nr:hypothetical protein GW17_00059225 [Ensete ventricosum]